MDSNFPLLDIANIDTAPQGEKSDSANRGQRIVLGKAQDVMWYVKQDASIYGTLYLI